MGLVRKTMVEVLWAIAPIVGIVIALHLTLVPLATERFLQFLAGAALVAGGLTLFLIGVQVGLLPMGELIGAALPRRGSLWLVLGFGFVLGLATTVAEPDVRVLAHLVSTVTTDINRLHLIYAVGIGVGLFVALSMLRTLLQVSLVWFLLPGYAMIFLLSLWVPPEFFAIAFDAGGVTTGPLTVPFVLALNVGLVSVLGLRQRLAGSFGLVALASIGPVLAVLILGIFARWGG